MTNIFSNRFFQGGAAIAVVAISFFAYQSFSGDEATEEAAQASTEATPAKAETTENVDAIEDNVENAVNNAEASDTINTTTEEATVE